VRAVLLEDGGEAAADAGSFFRSREFLGAEHATHSLLVGDRLKLPLIVRDDLDGGLRDAISPYGYPGGTAAGGPPIDPAEVDWSPTGLVSIFIREQLEVAGNGPLIAGASERGVVQIHDPSRPRKIRSRLAGQVRALANAGWQAGWQRGPETEAGDRERFHGVYTETMVRTGATARYFFDIPYFNRILEYADSWLVTACHGEDGFDAGAIAAISDGVLHYYLGGTADSALDESPFKLVVATMLALADELELPLNLGGGLRPGDGLERFKRGFANRTATFRTSEIVCDPAAYERLASNVDRQAAGDFFPLYRHAG